MLPRLTPVALVALLAAFCIAAPRAQAPNQRAMYVSVVNSDGEPVTDLGAADFVVREDNVVREVLTAGPATDPFQIAILVDNSQAARDMVVDLRKGLQEFVEAMTTGDDPGGPTEIALIGMADRPTVLAEYTSSRAQATKGIERIFAQPGSGMYFLDAVVDASKGLEKRKAPRPVILAVMTEGIEFSNRYYTDVLQALANSGAALYVVTVGRPATDLREETRNRNSVVDQGTRASGGAVEPVVASMALPARLKLVARQLKEQYRITYGRPQTLIPPEKITVEVKRPGLTARGTPVKEVAR